MARYTCYEIPEPNFDAGFTDELVVAELSEEVIIATMSDLYPNKRVDDIETTLLIKADLVDGKVPEEQLPDASTLQLGETETTAGRGDHTKMAYEHSQAAHAPSDAQKNVQPDWNQATNSADDYIKNKPTIPNEQVNSDWNATEGKAQILNKPIIPSQVTRDSLGLDTDDSPEFANTLNTALNTTAETGGEIAPNLWAWIQSVYSAIVAKSVKSHIIGLWTSIFNLEKSVNTMQRELLVVGNYYNQALSAIALTTVAQSSDLLYAYPYAAPKRFSINKIQLEVTAPVAGALSRISIYSNAQGLPNLRLAVSEDFDCSSNGGKEVNFEFTFEADRIYWICLHSNSTHSVRAIPLSALTPLYATLGTVTTTIGYRASSSQLFNLGSPLNFPSVTAVNTIPAKISFKVSAIL